MDTHSRATRLAISAYIQQIKRTWKTSIPGLFLPGIGVIFTNYIPPLVVAAAITRFGNETPTLHQALPYLAAFAGAWMAGELIWRVAFLFLNRADSRGIGDLLIDGLNQLTRKDIGFFHNNFAGSLTKKTVGYGKSYESFMDTLAFNVLAGLIPTLFASVILWQYSPLLVAVLYGLIGVMVILILPLIRRRKKLTDAREAASNHVAGYIADIIGNMDAVQTFAHEAYERTQHTRNVRDYTTKALHSWDYHTTRIDMAISPVYVAINVIGLAIAITLSDNPAGIAAVFVTFNYFAYVTRMMWEFNRIYRNLENAISEAAQFTALLLHEPAIKEADTPTELLVTKGVIDFKQVDFAYENRTHDPLFKNLSLHIAAGEKLALVGHSGGGKTTITKLLLRFIDVTGGQLLIDGQDIRKSRLADVRAAIAYVPQEPAMFHRTIRENIRYGKLDASEEAVEQAAKQANAHEFIMQLPQGYDTLVGERGVKLSGGQRQRIAIARAVIKDAPILVLDEATSALDSENEKLIQEALWQLMQGRTTIVIAHRLSTIQKMDRIIVLDQGVIVEQGSHAKLLKNKRVYAQLWAHQSGGFIEE